MNKGIAHEAMIDEPSCSPAIKSQLSAFPLLLS
jgi:hypothetical protein